MTVCHTTKHALSGTILALVPGSAFGDGCHVRLSYALSLDRIREATERLEDVPRDALHGLDRVAPWP